MNGVVNLLQVSRFLRTYDDAAAEKGIRLSIGFDFHEYVSITQATPTKHPTQPVFRPDRSPIKLGEGYWIMGLDKKNEVAYLQAARLFNLQDSNIGEHLQSLKVFYGEPQKHAHPQDSCACTAPSAKKIRGKVAYHGDLWLRKDFRGQGMLKTIGGIGGGITLAMWNPDFLCWLAQRWTLDNSVYNPPHYEPGGALLQLVEENIAEDNWLMWMGGEELRRIVDPHDSKEPVLAS
ncbi:hypothetical protein IVB27_10850 [Bradyrhizobium sp. 197]|uniref:hypothetical protein n=1 Tax=Bradyrhizobium sp. 197 TaxID=2782663 RepID=UPI001FF9729A|nr:hypothetical protein [Bradyrhizobium sp. 197]MCK1475284.1 hypothetical protein [Bradyrhizobium sp. 197]